MVVVAEDLPAGNIEKARAGLPEEFDPLFEFLNGSESSE